MHWSLRLLVLALVSMSLAACDSRRKAAVGSLPGADASTNDASHTLDSSARDFGVASDLGVHIDGSAGDALFGLENTVLSCEDGLDNDDDGYVDCDDFGCCSLVECGDETSCGSSDSGVPDLGTFDGGSGENTYAACIDSVDNDGDGYTDCNDFGCCSLVSCSPTSSCGMRDGGADLGRADASSTLENTVGACVDAIDNDGDGYTDCNDFGCCSLVSCSPTSSCGMRDGGTDASALLDSGPAPDLGPPSAESVSLTCGDASDNDGDGLIDCNDSDCCNVVSCGVGSLCGSFPDSCGSGSPHPIIRTLGTGYVSGSVAALTHTARASCDFNGPETFFEFVAPYSGSFEIHTDGSTYDTGLAVYSDICASTTAIDCDDDGGPSGTTTSAVYVTATAGQSFFIYIDAFYSDATGTFAITIGPT